MRSMSDHFFRFPGAIIDLWLLLPVLAPLEPSRVRVLDKGDFPAASPALQLLLACGRVVHIAKVLKPNEPIQLIAFREALCLASLCWLSLRVRVFVIPMYSVVECLLVRM